MTVALNTNLRNLGDFKNNLVVEGPDFPRREELETATATIFIGAIVTKSGQDRPKCALCEEDQAPAGIVEGYTNRNEPNQTYGYWYNDYDNMFASGVFVIVGSYIPGQILWVCSATNEDIDRGAYLKIVDGVLESAGTGDDFAFKAEEDVTGTADTRKYFRASVVKA